MIKNTIFSTSRFMNLCRKEMVEGWRTNLLRIAMVFGIMLVCFIGSGYFKYRYLPVHDIIDPMVSYSLKFFAVFGCIFGCLFASLSFSKLKTKTSRLSLIMTPATQFEKYFSRWLISVIVYILVFVILFMLADYMRVLVCRLIYPETTISPSCLKYLFVKDDGTYFFVSYQVKIWNVILLYFFTQSFFFLGSAVWPKNSFIKSATAGFGIIITYTLFAALVGRMFWGENIYISESSLNFDFNMWKNIGRGIIICFTLFNWVLAYYRFRESEIINRP